MKIIKRKISLDDFISKEPGTWGNLLVESFNINVFITQDSDDMGIMTDLDFVPKDNTTPDYQILTDKLSTLGLNFNFMNGGTFNTSQTEIESSTRIADYNHSDYFVEGGIVSGLTEDRLDVVKSYDRDLVYKPLFDVDKGVYLDYRGNNVNGVTRVNSNLNNLNPITYSEDVNISDPNIGTISQSSGLYFMTYNNIIRELVTPDLGIVEIPTTKMYYKSQGFNDTNTLIAANVKEEYLFGITTAPEVQSDVFIDRGRNTILQRHLQLGEITNISDLINYGNGFYKIIK